MALDEGLFTIAEGDAESSGALRFYGWDTAAITFGYGQEFDRIAPIAEQCGCDLTRRMTGGGVVKHGGDLTYALALLPVSAWYRRPAADLYRALHSGISQALRMQGINSTLQACNPEVPCSARPVFAQKQCFLSAEPLDVIGEHGVKLAGAAMKRDRRGLLVQGSIEMSGMLSSRREGLIDFIKRAWTANLQASWRGTGPEADLRTAQFEQLIEKYRSAQWNRRR